MLRGVREHLGHVLGRHLRHGEELRLLLPPRRGRRRRARPRGYVDSTASPTTSAERPAPPRSAADAILVEHASPVECKHRICKLPHESAEQRSVEREPLSPREWERRYPLTERHLRHHVLHEIRCRRAHPPTKARRAEPSSFACKRHKPCLCTSLAAKPREAPAQKPAVEIALELLSHEPGQRDRDRPVVDRGVERLEILRNDLVCRSVRAEQARPSRYSL